ncbi:MAG: rhodanese-like domain-containing protein [Rhodospirillaceae bacterium]|nr:rhodanese-like domain-containing protein [Rhodospirillales bacterium]
MTAYAGDITPTEAWEKLTSDANAKLIDVRTQAEWVYVGIPDLAPLDKKPLLVSWQVFPTMTKNEAFAQQLQSQGVQPGDTLLFLCRSGVRSKAAAELMTGLGYTSSYNILDGFEGGLDDTRHRGTAGGWKVAGLPWAQG